MAAYRRRKARRHTTDAHVVLGEERIEAGIAAGNVDHRTARARLPKGRFAGTADTDGARDSLTFCAKFRVRLASPIIKDLHFPMYKVRAPLIRIHCATWRRLQEHDADWSA